MNQGFFTSFSSDTSYNPDREDVAFFDSTGVYQVPSGTKLLYVFAVGAGGGGGGGAKYAAGTTAFGGAGGGYGALMYKYFLVEDLGGSTPQLHITIGAGGTGGAGPAGLSNSGAGGIGGGATEIRVMGGIGILLRAIGGGGGGGGSTGSGGVGGTSGGLLVHSMWQPTTGGAVGGGSTANGDSVNAQVYIGAHRGAGGGGKNASGTVYAGGSITTPASDNFGVITPGLPRGTNILAGGGAGVQGESNSIRKYSFFGLFSAGLGGAGGGGGTTTNAGNGGAGWRGGGGGGGGGGTNGFNSGTGGNGGNGFVAIKAIR